MSTGAEEADRASERRMTFFEHLEELRQRLKVIIIVIVLLSGLYLTTAIGSVTISGTQVPMLVPALGTTNANVASQFIVALENYLIPKSVDGLPVNVSFQQLGDPFVVMFKSAFFLAAVTGSPVIVYELGAFISPALKPSEKRLILRITLPVLTLFFAGVTVCFLVVLPFTFNLVYSVQRLMGASLLILYVDNFTDFVLLFSIAFGLAFQLPVVMYGLSWLGIIKADFWKKYWRFAAIAIFVFGAAITPDGSGITMMLVSLPMLGLYVIGYLLSVRVEARRGGAKSS